MRTNRSWTGRTNAGSAALDDQLPAALKPLLQTEAAEETPGRRPPLILLGEEKQAIPILWQRRRPIHSCAAELPLPSLAALDRTVGGCTDNCRKRKLDPDAI